MSPASSFHIPGYELIRELGVGGMATVHLAIQSSLDRKVALKVMRRNIDDAEKFEKRFLVEGRTLAKLPHRNIVAVYDIVKSESATYISMEYLEGGTLHDHMASGLSLGEAVAIVVQIAGALQFAHDHNVVHRDLKPANIMFRDELTPVLTDFGIARQQDAQSTRLTQTGMLVGTPTYMSPEQINALEVDGRSDLYSLGVMFFELLTGKPPFQGDSPIAVLMAHLTTPPPALPSPYEEFQPVLDRMLAKNRDERFADLKEFTKALKAVVVNNETLWTRLQADPNQSSSEQLRALGFSVSQTVGDALQSPAQLRRNPASSPGFRELPTQSGKLPQMAREVSQQRPLPPAPPRAAETIARASPERAGAASRTRPRWLLPAVIGALVILLGIGWLMLRPGPEIDPRIKADVDLRLRAVDQLIAEDKLIITDDTRSNAFDIFRGEQQRAPQYSGVVQRGEVLLAALKRRIKAQVDKGQFGDALITQGVVADIWPNDAEIAAMPAQIERARVQAEQSAEVERLLVDARRAEAEGRDLGPAGTYALLGKAAALMPADKRIQAARGAAVQRLLRPAQTALQSGDLEGASRGLDATAAQLRADPAWLAVRAQLDQAGKRRELDQRIAVLYARLDAAIAAGRLTEPASDNALQTLEQIRAADPAHRELAARTGRLADALLQSARGNLAAGDASAALQQIDIVLRIVPGQTAAVALKTEAEGKLSADQRRLVKLLGDARQAMVDGRFVAPAGNNARELVGEVLRLDPDNADARALRDGMTQRMSEAARQLAAQSKLEEAITLVRTARPLYPNDAALAKLAQELDAMRAGAELEQKRRDQIERIQRAADQRPLSESDVLAAIDLSAVLLQVNPRDVDVLSARHSLVDAIGESIAAAETSAELAMLQRLSIGYRSRYANDAAAARLVADGERASQRVMAAEQARAEASAGELVLVAYPWGKVESITDSARKPVALPADATTPVQLRLPAGVYRVVFSHPVGGRSSEKMVQVKSGARASASASFAQLDAREYARRAGL